MGKMEPGTIQVASEMIDQEASPEPGSAYDSIFGSDHHLDDGQHSADDSTGPSSVKEELDEDGDSGSGVARMPVQKRRRVTRACDECRRKKIKCDGKQPCTHCSVYSYDCTYDKPSNRRRNPAPQYIEALEAKLIRAEALLRKFIPDVDLNDPNLDPAVQQEFAYRERQRLHAAKICREEAHQEIEHNEARITSMIETIGQLDLTDSGGWDYRGTSSGAVFVKWMKEHFGGLLGMAEPSDTFLPRPSQVPALFKLDSPSSPTGSSPGRRDSCHVYDLPPKERARQLTTCALTCATALLRIVHVPSFFERFERIFDKPSNEFDLDDNRFLGLLYAVMAVGAMYNITEDDAGFHDSYEEATAEGINYYTSARILLQDVTECRDLTSLQALLFLILFLQSTSNLSGCYAFLGIASRAALRMGLHRHLPQANFTPLVTELRRRIFYFIRQLDIYCSALLGFPVLLHDEDVDQQLPTEVDDEFITDEGIQQPPPGTDGSFFQAFNAHSRLMGILMKVVKYIYPLKGSEACASQGSAATYAIEFRRIKEIENDLHLWRDQLPERWRPSLDGPIEVTRVRTLLRFAYAQVQMMLYRPFLHYISPETANDRTVDARYYACAAAGISVSRNIIHIAMEIKNQALVVGPFWSMLYTEFFAILILVFYVLESPDKQGTAEIWADAVAGRAMIAKLSGRSLAADRISKSIDTLWENLPEAVKNQKVTASSSKKRSASALTQGSVPVTTKKPASSTAKNSTTATGRKSVSKKRSSFDGVHRTSPPNAISLNFPELHSLDILSATTNSDQVAGTPASASSYMPTGSNQILESPSIYKLDALMFPSGDPFAYPNQPLDLGTGGATSAVSQPGLMGSVQARAQPTDSRNFYMPGLYGDIEGQLMGSLPPYLMQSNHNLQNGLGLPVQMYQNASALAMQQAQAQQHRQQQHQPALHPHSGRDMDDIMADSGLNRAWDMFGGQYKPI